MVQGQVGGGVYVPEDSTVGDVDEQVEDRTLVGGDVVAGEGVQGIDLVGVAGVTDLGEFFVDVVDAFVDDGCEGVDDGAVREGFSGTDPPPRHDGHGADRCDGGGTENIFMKLASTFDNDSKIFIYSNKNLKKHLRLQVTV